MKQSTKRPYDDTRLAKYIERRISDLRPRKTQIEIANEAGFRQPNMLAMIKNGSTKLPLDRVIGLSQALKCDAAMLFRMAIEQLTGDTSAMAIDTIFGAIITENEADWLRTLREASNDSDPSMTSDPSRRHRSLSQKGRGKLPRRRYIPPDHHRPNAVGSGQGTTSPDCRGLHINKDLHDLLRPQTGGSRNP